MSTKKNAANTGKASNGNKGNKGNAIANNAPAPAPTTAQVMDAATIASTAAAWLAQYKSIRGIKDTSATLIAKHGRDTYNAILTACKATRGAEISALHTSVKSVLSYNAVLDREYTALLASDDWRKWRDIIAATWDKAADFVAACYPNTLEDGKPARAVYFTNGTTIYRAFIGLQYADGAGAVAILRACLDNLKKCHNKAADKAKDGGAIVCTSTHKDGQPVAAYNAATETRTDTKGKKYAVLVRTTAADIAAATLAAINVRTAGKDGHRLPTLAEYNADLRA